MSTRILVLAVALLLMPATAEARQRMTFKLASEIAVDYWSKRDVTVPCWPTRVMLNLRQTQSLEDEFGFGLDMVSWEDRCLVGITPAAEVYRTDRDLHLKWLYCTDVAHEIGHIAGLSHEDGGLMDPARRGEVVPWSCAHPRRFKRLHSFRRDGVAVAR